VHNVGKKGFDQEQKIFTPDHSIMTLPIITSATYGNLAEVDWLLMEDAGVAMFVDDKGLTVAHYAAQFGMLSVLQRLHKSNSRVLSTSTPRGACKQPAHLAAQFNERKVLQWIACVDPALLETADNMDRTAMSIVARKKCESSTERARLWLGLGSVSTVRALTFLALLPNLVPSAHPPK